jgi:DNA processing protein
MKASLQFDSPSSINLFDSALILKNEILAYEKLWLEKKTNFKRIADSFKYGDFNKISDLVKIEELNNFEIDFKNFVKKDFFQRSNFLIKGSIDYPERLLDATDPVEVLYTQGDLSLINSSKLISVVGTRKPTQEGIERTRILVRDLVKNGFVIVSGLAEGIDTIAHKAAIHYGGKTIAVIGTPLDQFYPKSNIELQKEIMREHLVISQVPFMKYKLQNPSINKFFFPERNKTMSALSAGTIIVEASETSGTLIQARAAIQQGRELFILNSCFENSSIKWPEQYLAKGAHRVLKIDDILSKFEDLEDDLR